MNTAHTSRDEEDLPLQIGDVRVRVERFLAEYHVGYCSWEGFSRGRLESLCDDGEEA